MGECGGFCWVRVGLSYLYLVWMACVRECTCFAGRGRRGILLWFVVCLLCSDYRGCYGFMVCVQYVSM